MDRYLAALVKSTTLIFALPAERFSSSGLRCLLLMPARVTLVAPLLGVFAERFLFPPMSCCCAPTASTYASCGG